MRLLLLSSRVPYPVLNGEDLRVWEFVKHLASRHVIDVIAYREIDPVQQEAQRYFRELHLLPSAEPKPQVGGLKRLREAFDPGALFDLDPRIESLLNRALRENSYDWLWIPSWQMMPYAHGVTRANVLFDVMDDGVLELFREVRCSTSLKQMAVNTKRLFVTYLFERKYFSSAGCCCLVTDEDARVLKKVCPTANILTVPNGVDSEYFSPQGSVPQDATLIFEGNMSFGPSVDAIVYFCRDILPKIRSQEAGAKLLIVGRNPTEEVRQLQSANVIVTGSVDDVRPYLDRAAVFVCPMRKGAGIKNKLLQAWAMAKPVVATPVAAAGLDARQGDNILLADGPDEFAAHVLALLRSPDERGRLGRRGRETVLQHHTWDRQVRLLEEELASH